MEKSTLIIPVYVDTNALLDLLATVEGGFSVVEKISTKEERSREGDFASDATGGTEFGIPNVLNLLKLSVSLRGDVKTSKKEELSQETNKYHTYGSLLCRLRDYLDKKQLIKRINSQHDWDTINSGDFVEIYGVFEPNPLMHGLITIDGLLEIVQLLNPAPRNKKQQRRKGPRQDSEPSLSEMRKFIHGLLSGIRSENIRTFVVESVGPQQFHAVILVYLDYLRDKTMSELIYREYRLLGKVVRKVSAQDDSPIDLLMGYSLQGLSDESLGQLIEAFQEMPQVNLPEMKTKIPAPALEIVPIAIYV